MQVLHRRKVRVSNCFRPGSTGSVLFLDHGCPVGQLFRHRPRANLRRKLRYEIALTITKFAPAPGLAAADPPGPVSTFHGSMIARHAPPSAHHSSPSNRHRLNQSLAKHNRKPFQLIENKQQRRKSIVSFCRVFRGYTTLFQAPQNRHRVPLNATHQLTVTIRESHNSQTPTHGIIMLSCAQRASLTKSPAALPVAGYRRGTKPASACGHLTLRHYYRGTKKDNA